MKIAIQELMQWFNEKPQCDKKSEDYEIMLKAQELLAKDKKHIEDVARNAYNAGVFAAQNGLIDTEGYIEYINETYQNK